MRLNMNTYFIKGITCEALMGSHTWQKSIAQKLVIDLEWRPTADQPISLFDQNNQHNIENILNGIIELVTSKHWLSIDELGEFIKMQIQQKINTAYLQLKIKIPCAFAQTESVGIIIQIP